MRTSGGQHVLATVPAEPALVIATPGAEPVAPNGYAGALLLDGWALLGRPKPTRGRGGTAPVAERGRSVWLACPVVVLAEVSLPAAQALIRWLGRFCRTRAG